MQRNFLRRFQFVLACAALTGGLGLALLRVPQTPAPAPASGEESPPVQGAGGLVGAGDDGVVRLEVALHDEVNGGRLLVSTVRNLTKGAIELHYDCDNLVRLNGLTVIRDCYPLPSVRLEPGQSGKEERFLPVSEIRNPTVASLNYALPGHPVSTLDVNLVPENQAQKPTANDVAELLKAAGLQVTAPVESSVKLFGATRVDNLTAQGKVVGIYAFPDNAAAKQALKVASDPSAHTVSWVEEPQFMVKENLLIAIISSDTWVVKQVVIALTDPTPITFKPFIQKERAIDLARAVGPTLTWEAHLVEQRFDVTVRGTRVVAPLWIVEARDAANQATVLYLDAKTGKVMTKLQVAAPGYPIADGPTPEAAVQRYFALTSAGKYEEAWTLLHPVAQKPNPPTALGLRLARFFEQEGTPGPKLKEILQVTLPKDTIGSKDPSCMCLLQKARVLVRLEDGTERTIEVARAADGTWGVMWPYER